MLLTFPLLLAAGAGCRLALSQTLRLRYGLSLEVPQVLAIGLLYSIVGLSRRRSGYRPDVPDYHTLHSHTRCRHRYNSEELRRCDCAAVGGRFHWLNWHRGAS